MLLWDNTVYVWYKLTRVTGKVGKCTKDTFASVKSDAAATGVFSDSVERVITITINSRTSKEEAFRLYKEALIENAIRDGYMIQRVLSIPRKEYKILLNEWLKKTIELDEEFYAPAYEGKRTTKR